MFKKQKLAEKRKERLRSKIRKVSDRKRLSVFKSGRHLYAQVIDDSTSSTLISVSTLDKKFRTINKSNCNKQKALLLGEEIAKKAASIELREVVFDKGSHKYHGVVKAFADAARKEINF